MNLLADRLAQVVGLGGREAGELLEGGFRDWAAAGLPLMLTIVGLIAVHLVVFFVNALMCHGELARTRPAPSVCQNLPFSHTNQIGVRCG